MKKNILISIILLNIFLSSQFLIAESDSSRYAFKEHEYTAERSQKVTPVRANSGGISSLEINRKYYTHLSKNYYKIDNSENSLWNGKHWSEESFPLKVYLEECSSKNYKRLFKDYIDYAFTIWKEADERISFIYSDDKNDAMIVICFEDNLMNKYDENYLGMTEYQINHKKEIEKAEIEIGLLKFNKPVSDGEIKSTIIHEVGHALGLGHSSNELDLMYPYINPRSSKEMNFVELSSGDVEAIKSVNNLGQRTVFNEGR